MPLPAPRHDLQGDPAMALDKTTVLNNTCKYGALEAAGSQVSEARVALTWTDSSGDSVASGTDSFTGTPDAAVDAVGFYSAATGGTYYGNATLTATEGELKFNAEGKFDVTAVTVTA